VAQRKYIRPVRHSEQEIWRIFCQGGSDILNAGKVHKIVAINPVVMFVSPLILPGECTASGEKVLNLMLETQFPGSEDMQG
jgi:hypothetical protein